MLDAHDDFVKLATARGDKRIIARKPAVKLGWAYLRRSIHRKPPDKGER